MKIISFNIRGLGGRVKKKEVKELVRLQKPNMLCLQETKMEGVDRSVCSMLWEGDEFEWASKDAVGRSGGLIVLWNRECFEVVSVFTGSNFLGLEGFWGKDRVPISMVNVHAPCDFRGKKLLWDELVGLMESRGGDKWCIIGDFNSIKAPCERKGVGGISRSEETHQFGEFISEAGLIDLPLIRRKYTWYKPDGTAMSRLDRFLISEEWLNTWGNLSQWGLKRSVLDHCPVVLKEKEINWGPKPFRMLNYWEKLEGYEEFVKNE